MPQALSPYATPPHPPPPHPPLCSAVAPYRATARACCSRVVALGAERRAVVFFATDDTAVLRRGLLVRKGLLGALDQPSTRREGQRLLDSLSADPAAGIPPDAPAQAREAALALAIVEFAGGGGGGGIAGVEDLLRLRRELAPLGSGSPRAKVAVAAGTWTREGVRRRAQEEI